jgi:phosphatidylglycerophosphatase A
MPQKTNSTPGETIPDEISGAIASASPQGPGAPPPPLTPAARLAYALGTVAGLGYVKPAPGTWGSFVGLILYALIARTAGTFYYAKKLPLSTTAIALAAAIVIGLLGVWAAGLIEKASLTKDPQFVIIDEVSGQMLALSAAFAPLNWKYLLLGFILFRVFDISKIFPARQAENLPGGWGIMADDWIAALQAAVLLWLARALGL